MRWTKGAGAWPAFWMSPANQSAQALRTSLPVRATNAELDIFEGQGDEPTTFYGTFTRTRRSVRHRRPDQPAGMAAGAEHDRTRSTPTRHSGRSQIMLVLRRFQTLARRRSLRPGQLGHEPSRCGWRSRCRSDGWDSTNQTGPNSPADAPYRGRLGARVAEGLPPPRRRHPRHPRPATPAASSATPATPATPATSATPATATATASATPAAATPATSAPASATPAAPAAT